MIVKVLASFLMYLIIWVNVNQAVSSECHLCESLITKSDQCTFLLDESTEHPAWSCPLVFPCGRIISINYDFLMDFRAIQLQKLSKCNKFVINTQNFTRYRDFFNAVQIFVPYSVIILLENGNEGDQYKFSKDQTDYMYNNALHVIQLYQSQEQITISNVLTGDKSHGTQQKMPHITSVLRNIEIHPLIDTTFSTNEINVSLLHNTPLVIDKYLNDPIVAKENPTMDSKRFDGAEYLLMAHITRRWKRRFFMPDTDNEDPWDYIVLDVIKRRTNIALSGLWLTREYTQEYENSYPYMQQCVTLLVPRLPRVPRTMYIYLALQKHIWIFYIFVLCTSLLVYIFMTVTTNSSNQFQHFTKSILQVLAIAVQQGIPHFPRRFSAKILLMAWIIFSFQLAAIYSTGYTSLLTTSLFMKPINTIQDVIDNQLIWGDISEYLQSLLFDSGNTELMQLAELMIYSESEEAEELLAVSKYGEIVTVLNSNVMTGSERFENISSKYRVMNTCIYKVYTIFAFEKNSPYVQLFNREIPKYVESGLTQYWMNLVNDRYGKHYIYTFFVETRKMMPGPHVLSVDHVAIGLYILGVGLTFATGVFILELLHFYVKNVFKKSEKNILGEK